MKRIPTRQKIINSAHRLFYKRGFNGTSIDDILKDAELNKGSLYHLFRSKKEVLLAVIEEKIAYSLEQKYKNIGTVEHPLKYLKKNCLLRIVLILSMDVL